MHYENVKHQEMMTIVLINNIMEYNGEYFLQLQGTAMGTKMAPAYANLFMASIEQELQNLGGDHIKLWRFIDDILRLTKYTQQSNSLKKRVITN